MHIAVLATVITLSCLAWGVVQERLTSVPYGEGPGAEVFHGPFALNLVVAAVSIVVAFIVQACDSRGRRGAGPEATTTAAPHAVVWPSSLSDALKFIGVSLAYTCGSPLGYAALAYIPFPLLVLATSCKLLPIMLVGLCLHGKSYSQTDLVSAAAMVVGVAAYALPMAEGGGGSTAEATLLGLGLVGVNLIVDALMINGQDALFKAHRLSASQMMLLLSGANFGLNAAYLAGEAALRGAQGSSALRVVRFLQAHPEAVAHVAAFAVLAAASQAFIYQCVKEHGSFVTSAVSIGRKFWSVLLSVALFGHRLTAFQWAGVVAVFAGLALQMFWAENRSHLGPGKRGASAGGAAAVALARLPSSAEELAGERVQQEEAAVSPRLAGIRAPPPTSTAQHARLAAPPGLLSSATPLVYMPSSNGSALTPGLSGGGAGGSPPPALRLPAPRSRGEGPARRASSARPGEAAAAAASANSLLSSPAATSAGSISVSATVVSTSTAGSRRRRSQAAQASRPRSTSAAARKR